MVADISRTLYQKERKEASFFVTNLKKKTVGRGGLGVKTKKFCIIERNNISKNKKKLSLEKFKV